MSFTTIRKLCSNVRLLVGLILIGIGVYTGIYWFYLGILPVIVGVTQVCPLCAFTKKCEVVKNRYKKKKEERD